MITGLGNALVDACVQIPDDEVLDRLGLRRGTMHLMDDAQWQTAFAAVEHLEHEIHPGGSCANAVVTAGLLGADCDLCANVCDDRFGRIYADKVAEVIGDHHVRLGQGTATGKCLSLISAADAERTMLTDLGCAMDLPGEALFTEAIQRSDLFHCTGYLFTGGPIGAVADRALAVAREAGTRISFDVADPWVIEAHRARYEAIVLEMAHVVFLNEEEARLWGGVDDPVEGAASVAAHVPIVALKLGSRGSAVLTGDTITEIGVDAAVPIDTTGAGDAYAGGFLYGLDRGLEPARCARIASRIAAATVSQVGAVVRDRERAHALIADLL
jgi:sugar/nucleoside kinase (ribokinase family)